MLRARPEVGRRPFGTVVESDTQNEGEKRRKAPWDENSDIEKQILATGWCKHNQIFKLVLSENTS